MDGVGYLDGGFEFVIFVGAIDVMVELIADHLAAEGTVGIKIDLVAGIGKIGEGLGDVGLGRLILVAALDGVVDLARDNVAVLVDGIAFEDDLVDGIDDIACIVLCIDHGVDDIACIVGIVLCIDHWVDHVVDHGVDG